MPTVPETRPDRLDQLRAAVASRDPRFDGWFVAGDHAAGVYCRPACPHLADPTNVRILASAAAAQREGLRACLRCPADAIPGSPDWHYRPDVVGRALRLIADGVVDRDGVAGLAARVGRDQRHLDRLLHEQVGAGPLALARAQRAQTARLLIETTNLGLAEIAAAAGFGSVRQLTDTARAVFGASPSVLRGTGGPTAGPGPAVASRTVTLRLPYRAPLHAASLLGFLATRTIDGVDEVAEGGYRRGLILPYGLGRVEIQLRPGYVQATLRLDDVRDLAPALARCRRLLDLDADPVAIDAALAADAALAPAVAKEPGVRVPGAVDGFEMAVRAIIGQQISVAGARTVLARLVAHANLSATPPATPPATPSADHEPKVMIDTKMAPKPHDRADLDGAGTARVLRGFPTAAMIAAAPDEAFAMPAARRRTLRELAGAIAAGRIRLDAGADRDETAAALLAIRGIGPWTAQYVAARALGDPDVLLPTDLGVRRGAATLGLPDDPAGLRAHAEQHWAPWRSYATIRLWRYA